MKRIAKAHDLCECFGDYRPGIVFEVGSLPNIGY